ncbi:MAG: hypothetical protein GYA42_07910 [Syntrophomonadaceae bacterium]|nr:hypothetical protein [Syntrophomonadaceae bacterium]
MWRPKNKKKLFIAALAPGAGLIAYLWLRPDPVTAFRVEKHYYVPSLLDRIVDSDSIRED